jgi:cytochrome P450
MQIETVPLIEDASLANVDIAKLPLSTLKYLRRMSDDLLGAFHERAFDDLIVERQLFHLSAFLISDPDGVKRVLVENAPNYKRIDSLQPVLAPLVGNGLVTSEGDTWRNHRRIMAPAFDHRTIHLYGEVIERLIREQMKRWDALADNTTVDIGSEMMRLTLEIIFQSICSEDDSELQDLIAEAVATFFPQMKFSTWSVLPGIKHVWAKRARTRGEKQIKSLDTALYALIRGRRSVAVADRPKDLLSLLISSEGPNGKPLLTDQEVRDELMTVMTAGHETSAMALSWMWYLLSERPHIEAQILKEISQVLGGRLPNANDIGRLPYTRAVVDEVLRLYPPVHTLGWRQTVDRDRISGVDIPKNSIITVVPWVIHRHRLLWRDPELFDPNRFLREDERAGRSKFSYIPFSVGPHVCLGSAFALTEMILVVATLLPHFSCSIVSEVKPHGLVTLHTKEPLLVQIRRRKI